MKLNLLFKNYSYSLSMLSSKNNGTYSKKQAKEQICIHEIIWLIITEIKMKNRSHRYDIYKPRGLFIWVRQFHLGGTSHLSEILSLQGLHKKNIPPDWRYFSSQLACVPIFKCICYFHCLFNFLF